MNSSHKGIVPPRISRKQIINLAEGLVRSYFTTVGRKFQRLGVSFDAIYEEFIYPQYEIELIEDEYLGSGDDDDEMLGAYEPATNRVFVDARLRENNDPRRVFTCWHEVGGHAILQGDWLRSQLNQKSRDRTVVTTASMFSPNVESVLERQANLYASHAAAPTWLVGYAIHRCFGVTRPLRYIGPRKYSFALRSGTRTHAVDSFPEYCYWISRYIQRWFGKLSVEALSYRVADSTWVADLTNRTARRDTEFRLHRTSRSRAERVLPSAVYSAP